jgi:hypothetical protein
MAWTTPRTTDRLLEVLEANYEAVAAGDLDGLINRVV